MYLKCNYSVVMSLKYMFELFKNYREVMPVTKLSFTLLRYHDIDVFNKIDATRVLSAVIIDTVPKELS